MTDVSSNILLNNKEDNSKKKPRNKEKRANGEGTLRYNEKTKTWTCQVSYKNLLGEQKRKSFSGKTKKDVIYRRNCFLEQNASGLVPVKSELTIPSVLKPLYERELELNQISKSGYTRKQSNLKIIEKSNLGDIPISSIQEGDLRTFFSAITRYSNSVIAKLHQMLKKAFNLACELKIIARNPLNVVSNLALLKPKSAKKDKVVRAFNTQQQKSFIELLTAAQFEKNRNNYKNQLFISLYTGMRMGEINALTIKDLDFSNKLIYVTKTISTSGNGYQPYLSDNTKTESGTRIIPMNELAEKYLKQSVDNYIPNRGELLFFNYKRNTYITTNQVCNWFRRFCEKNNLPYYGQHMLRHTFATRAIEAGVPAEVLRDWLGHKDIATTINTYYDAFNRKNDSFSNVFVEYSKVQLLS